MATVVLAWQLGAGAGHATRLLPFAKDLIAAGHDVIGVFCDINAAAKMYSGLPIRFIAAPHRVASKQRFRLTFGYAHLLANVGFGTDEDLASLATVWREIFEQVRPDLTIFDHSPVGLLASRGLPMKRVIIGSGFFCPPDTFPLPKIMRPAAGSPARDDSEAVEEELHKRCNVLLDRWKAEPLQRLGNLYSQLDDIFLTTFPELDHFGMRPGGKYRGATTASGYGAPRWPAALETRKIFGYLKPFPAMEPLFEFLVQRGYPALIVSDNIPAAVQKRFESPTLRFSQERLDMAQANAAADLVLMNGNHGTLCSVLLGGKVSLQFPLFPEQMLVSLAAKRIGATEILPLSKLSTAQIGDSIEKILSTPSYAEAAANFARRYSNFDQERAQLAMCEKVRAMLDPGTP